MSKEAEEYFEEYYKEEHHPKDLADRELKVWDWFDMCDFANQFAEAYHQANIRPVQMELERWKYLYQTEFNKNKIQNEGSKNSL